MEYSGNAALNGDNVAVCVDVIDVRFRKLMSPMKRAHRKSSWVLLAIFALTLTPAIYAGNDVMGQIQFEGKSHVEKTSGVWVDGGYVGFLKELKGSKKILLLPGEHVVTVRQAGFQDFTQQVLVHPGQVEVVHVAMTKAPRGAVPAVMSTIKIGVNPTRAAVFVDGQFIGHVGEFKGPGRGLLVVPGEHKIRVALPGYETFETAVNSLPNQSVEIKTELVKNDSAVTDPLLETGKGEAAKTPASVEAER